MSTYRGKDFRIGRRTHVQRPATPGEKAFKKESMRVDALLAKARFTAEGFEGVRGWDRVDPCDGQFDSVLVRAHIADLPVGGTFEVQTWDGPVTVTKVER